MEVNVIESYEIHINSEFDDITIKQDQEDKELVSIESAALNDCDGPMYLTIDEAREVAVQLLALVDHIEAHNETGSEE
ncbi:hypothetical protein UFOVP1528_4 [uncultured Caudovirales phage]|uniref:Uncharacterized protein n=1 Tax=uncultured Caudovirales phage TaxID=2100421 RepID=A0A6J5RZN7_9CAUD|nr:hypothetical protein UFOVP905_22 [uncultured Caudovirales phage]CAB4182540.1 hypothetical protein UFOVP1080_9 [uncultured Caudovirales phage]CAB4197905.1 hypothetical protein UFOVP1321_47 [uncultured Caudovirales phage]CAB4212462.1 hypothetical protein UFOVP1432_17 [uncultured Caudovirales phage]CAB5227123.1 hypothetical protein UFOVP1528_4 [uncultured Caudovirales phage]